MRCAVVAGLVGVVAACSRSPAPAEDEAPAAAAVTCALPDRRSVPSTVVLRGVVTPPPRADAILSSTIAGMVTDVLVEVGDAVTAGQLVARVDDPSLYAGTQEGKAAIAAADAEVIAAESAMKRMTQMADKGVASRQELEDATARLATARANLAAARARSAGASGQAARADLRAPRAGIVLRVFRRGGEAVDGTPTTPILEIADIAVLELRADAAAADLVKLAPGATAAITFDALPGVTVPGTLSVVSPAVDPATALGQVRVALSPPKDTRLLVGLTGTATVTLAAHDAVVVPTGALRRGASGGDEVVVCAGSPARARVTAVVVGTRLADVVEIAEGLAAGDRVVVDHALGLADDQPLDDGAAPAAGSAAPAGSATRDDHR